MLIFNVIKVIENDEKSREDFKEKHDSCGTTEFYITKEQLTEILNGKTIAMSDGEYCNFLSLKVGE